MTAGSLVAAEGCLGAALARLLMSLVRSSCIICGSGGWKLGPACETSLIIRLKAGCRACWKETSHSYMKRAIATSGPPFCA